MFALRLSFFIRKTAKRWHSWVGFKDRARRLSEPKALKSFSHRTSQSSRALSSDIRLEEDKYRSRGTWKSDENFFPQMSVLHRRRRRILVCSGKHPLSPRKLSSSYENRCDEASSDSIKRSKIDHSIECCLLATPAVVLWPYFFIHDTIVSPLGMFHCRGAAVAAGGFVRSRKQWKLNSTGNY